jgi:hypothetical protein
MRRRRVNAMVADAHFLRSQRECADVREAIAIEKRRAMFRFALGEITLDERDVILRTIDGTNGQTEHE